MAGYFNNAHETDALAPRASRAFIKSDRQRPWLHTGDLGYLDEDSFLFIVDRQKDLIKTSGYQVWPREVEEVLAAHPSVQEVGVAGVPDAVKGEVVKAWVVDAGRHTANSRRASRLLPGEPRAYKTPAQVEFRESLPKTMAGKVLRRALVEEHKKA